MPRLTPDGQTLYGVIDQYTGQAVTYQKTKVWEDRDWITPEKVDGIIYIMYNGNFYKRVIEGSLDVRILGAKNDLNFERGDGRFVENATDNYPIIQKFIDQHPTYSNIELDFPKGSWYFSNEPVVNNLRSIHLHGVYGMPYSDWRTSSCLFFAEDKGGFNIIGERRNDKGEVIPRALPSSIHDIHFYSLGTHYTENKKAGLYHEVIMDIQRVRVDGFGNGFVAIGGVEAGSNASLSRYQSCVSTHNKGDGFAAHSGDANNITYDNCISLQNWHWGFMDNSQLGCYFHGCQAATNGTKGMETGAVPGAIAGGYCILQDTAAAVVASCYNEGDQLPSYIGSGNKYANVIGGSQNSRWCGNAPGQPYKAPGGNIKLGTSTNEEAVDLMYANDINFGSINLKDNTPYGQNQKIGAYTDGGRKSFFEMVAANTPTAQFDEYNNSQPIAKRSLPMITLGLNENQVIGTELHIIGDEKMPSIPFVFGDEIRNAHWKEDQPRLWKCIQAGRNHDLRGDEFSIVNMTTNGGDQERQRFELANPDNYKLLVTGDTLTMPSGRKAQVHDIVTQYLVEIARPRTDQIEIKNGDRITYMGDFIPSMNPVKYDKETITLNYKPYDVIHKVGEEVNLNGFATTVKSVTIDKGVQLVEVNAPKESDNTWFDKDINNVVFNGVVRRPAFFNRPEKAAWTPVIAFPMGDLVTGATVWVDHYPVKVVSVKGAGVVIKGLEGSVWSDQAGLITVDQPKFKAFI